MSQKNAEWTIKLKWYDIKSPCLWRGIFTFKWLAARWNHSSQVFRSWHWIWINKISPLRYASHKKDPFPIFFVIQPAQTEYGKWELQAGEDWCLWCTETGCVCVCVYFNSHQSCTHSYNPEYLWTLPVLKTVPLLWTMTRTRTWCSLLLWGTWLWLLGATWSSGVTWSSISSFSVAVGDGDGLI